MRATLSGMLASCFMPSDWWQEANAALEHVVPLYTDKGRKQTLIELGPPMKIDGTRSAFGNAQVLVDGQSVPVESISFASE